MSDRAMSDRAMGAGFDPRQGQRAKSRLITGRWLSARAGTPSPSDKTVFGVVLMNSGEIASAIAFRIFNLCTDFSSVKPDPAHRYRRQKPRRVAGDRALRPGISNIFLAMTGCAFKTGNADPARAARDGRLMGRHGLALTRLIITRMTIHAPGMADDFVHFRKQRLRTRLIVFYGGEGRDCF